MPKFPAQQRELLTMFKEEQKELRAFPKYSETLSTQTEKTQALHRVREKCHKRAHRMSKILDEIKKPTIDNIGKDGSQALAILTLHAHLDLMKKVHKLFEQEFRKNRKNIYFEVIPALQDRIDILERKKPKYGTNWSNDEHDKPFLIAVEDFSKLNELRSIYGLEPAKRPTNLAIGAIKHPLGKGLAREGDQKELNEEDYVEYSRYLLEPLILSED